jgi:hypothetical protein
LLHRHERARPLRGAALAAKVQFGRPLHRSTDSTSGVVDRAVQVRVNRLNNLDAVSAKRHDNAAPPVDAAAAAIDIVETHVTLRIRRANGPSADSSRASTCRTIASVKVNPIVLVSINIAVLPLVGRSLACSRHDMIRFLDC